MLIESDVMHGIVHPGTEWRPFVGPERPPWTLGRVRAVREAEDDAQTVLSLLFTGLATHAVDPAEVLWVIDLAPGEGERAWRVLRALSARAPRAPSIRYLARCAGTAHYERLAAHPLLAPLIASGDLSLDREGRGVPSQRMRNPIVVLAHEGLSAQPQGLYTARAGELKEAWSDDRGALEWRATTQRDGVMRLLWAYRQSLDGVAFTLPHGAMQTLSALLHACGGRLLLRASDQGAREITQIRRGVLAHAPDPAFTQDAYPSLPVNFEALARWHLAHGASVHQTQRDDEGRVLHLALHDIPGGRLQECLPEIIGLPHPDDHLQLLLALESLSAASPAQCLSLLHAHAGDSRALLALSRHLLRAASAIEGVALNQWRDMLTYCRAQYYPSPGHDVLNDDMSVRISQILRKMQDHSCESAATAAQSLAPEGVPSP